MPAASSAATATRSRAGSTASASRSSTRCRSAWCAEVRRDGKLYRQEFARGVPLGDVEVVGSRERHRHDDHLPAGRRDLRGARPLDADARPAPPGDRLPDARPADRARRRARGRGSPRVLRRGRDQGLRRLRQRRQGSDPQAHRLLRGRERRRRSRGRDAVEHVLRRVRVLVREQHQHARGRHPPLRLPRRAHRAR